MSHSSEADPLVDHVVEKGYRIVERIGGGGTGAVYRAVQAGALDREVAIKIVNSTMTEDSSARRRFESEARILSTLRHPNTVKLFDTGRLTDGRLFVVTELLRGATIRELLERDGALGLERGLDIARQISGALVEAHELGILHRDIKTSNIFVENVAGEDVVRVLDFGIAKTGAYSNMTDPSFIVGTPGYMSPEQCQGDALDGRSDVYSLGVVLFESITGEPPFRGRPDDPVDLMLRHVNDPAPRLQTIAGFAAVDDEIDALVAEMLAKHPAARPQSMNDVHQRLDALSSEWMHGATQADASNPVAGQDDGDRTLIKRNPSRVPSTPSTPRSFGALDDEATLAVDPAELSQLSRSAETAGPLKITRASPKQRLAVALSLTVIGIGLLTIMIAATAMLSRARAPIAEVPAPPIQAKAAAVPQKSKPDETVESKSADEAAPKDEAKPARRTVAKRRPRAPKPRAAPTPAQPEPEPEPEAAALEDADVETVEPLGSESSGPGAFHDFDLGEDGAE